MIQVATWFVCFILDTGYSVCVDSPTMDEMTCQAVAGVQVKHGNDSLRDDAVIVGSYCVKGWHMVTDLSQFITPRED